MLRFMLTEMLILRLEDFEDKNDQNFTYYANKKNQWNKINISNDLYDRVMESKELKISRGTYKKYTYSSYRQINKTLFYFWLD